MTLAPVATSARGRAPAILFVLAILSGNIQLLQGHAPPFGAYFEALNVARTLAQTGEFANPYTAGATGPTAHLAPLLPALLGVFIRALGFGTAFYVVVTAGIVLTFALQAALLPAVSELLAGSRLPGIWAGALAAILPISRIGSPGDCLFLGPWLLLFLLLSRKALDHFGDLSGGALTGGMAGLLLLWSPASLAVLAIWTLRLSSGARWRFAATAALATVLICLPWTLRNYRTLGAPVFIRDNLGLELRISNNPRATPTFAGNVEAGVLGDLHPNFNPAEAGRVRELGEIAYNRACLSAAKDWARHNPGRFLRLTGGRILNFWFPQGGWPLGALTLLSVAGLAGLASRNRAAAATLGAILLAYPIVYYFVQADERYRYPILWVTVLLAGFAITSLAGFRVRPACGARLSLALHRSFTSPCRVLACLAIRSGAAKPEFQWTPRCAGGCSPCGRSR